MNKSLVFGLLVVAALMFNVAALNSSEEQDLTSRAMRLLDKDVGVYASEVRLGSDNSLDMIIAPLAGESEEAAQKNIKRSIEAAVGVYILAVHIFPELTDLHITLEATELKPVLTFYCDRSWIKSIKLNSEGGLNQDDLNAALMKTLATIKTV